MKARRVLERDEFEDTLEVLNSRGTHTDRFMAPGALKLQFAMIARVDDTSHFKREELKSNPMQDGTLLAQMCWSKNVLNERDAPDQILFGADNCKYCILLAIAIHLEGICTNAGTYCFCYCEPKFQKNN